MPSNLKIIRCVRLFIFSIRKCPKILNPKLFQTSTIKFFVLTNLKNHYARKEEKTLNLNFKSRIFEQSIAVDTLCWRHLRDWTISDNLPCAYSNVIHLQGNHPTFEYQWEPGPKAVLTFEPIRVGVQVHIASLEFSAALSQSATAN